MNELHVTGKQKIGKFEFTGIEGGFGEDKKAMMVKDISEIHQTEVRRINEVINRNRKRFKNSLDIIDLKQVVQNDVFSDYGFTKAQWGNAKNIYILSERGYAKLLKILEDDTAWEIYDQLVDGYFTMRQAIKTNQPILTQNKRLEIMEENAKTRKASMLYKIAMATNSDSGKERLLAEAGKAITGEMVLPVMKQKEYSAGEVAELIGDGLTANMVGRIANQLGLKAEQPGQNQYGRWANSKSKYSSKDTPQWLYSDKGVEAIKNERLQTA